MNKENTQLAVRTSIHPPPTRREIITAAVDRERSNYHRRASERADRKKVLMSSIHKIAVGIARKRKISEENSTIGVQFEAVELRLKIPMTPEIKPLWEELCELNGVYESFNEKTFRQRIESQLDANQVDRLLSDPKAIKAIDLLISMVKGK